MRTPTSPVLTAKTSVEIVISNFTTSRHHSTGLRIPKTDPGDYVNILGVTIPTGVVLQQAFEERNRKVLFKKSHFNSIKIDLRNVILLDSQYSMDLFCNTKLVRNIYKTNKNILLQSNGGTMIITHKSKVANYNPHVWFYQKYITKLIAIKNIIKQHHVTYNSLDEMFIVHIEEHGKHNVKLRMHESGLHYYDPEDEEFLFLNTVADNKESYIKQHIKDCD